MMFNEWNKLINYVKKKHAGQKDDAGMDYYTAHIEQVVDIVWQIVENCVYEDQDAILTAAMLHDILEDTDVTEKQLRKKFGDKITDLVVEVTHTGERNSDGAPVFANLHSREAIIIKYADRLSNLSRMTPWTKERQQKYIDRSRFWITNKDEVKKFTKEMI